MKLNVIITSHLPFPVVTSSLKFEDFYGEGPEIYFQSLGITSPQPFIHGTAEILKT
jgi:hypothetical protein